jgi:hypothetical protein
MSNNLARYTTIPGSERYGGDEMGVTATMQGDYGSAIQFTVGGKFAILSPNQLRDLVQTIEKRLSHEKGYSATDYCDERLVPAEREIRS